MPSPKPKPDPNQVFPGASSRRRIVMDASTAHFHRSNHMDFNKWINHF